MRIGYPQSLLYYKYFPLWERFFTELGAEVVPSGPTTKRTVSQGTIIAENELCLPVKVFYGHLHELKDKVDAIFVPRIVSVAKKEYTCPKFLGLPDMARAVEMELPPIIGNEINFQNGWRDYLSGVYELGKVFTPSRTKIAAAYMKAIKVQGEYVKGLETGTTPDELLENKKPVRTEAPRLRIGLAGHPYNIYDRYISMNLIKRLKDMGAEVKTAEMLPHMAIEREASRLPKKLFWTYEKEVVGTVFHWANTRSVDGIIYVLSFACGPDSLVQVLLEHELRATNSVPMMPLVIDEHSAEAGLITRVEAFVDMLSRKKDLLC